MSRQVADQDFIRSLKPGDRVGICDRGEVVYQDNVERITPTGLIRLSRGGTFKPTGYMRDPVYYFRFLVKP